MWQNSDLSLFNLSFTEESIFLIVLVLLWSTLFVKARRTTQALQALSGQVDNELAIDSSVSVIIPARNEAEIIERSTLAALAQGPLLESLIVVDDDSEDDTAEILSGISQEHQNLTVLRGHVLEPGDCGKPSALAWAYDQTPITDEWVLFLDADVILAPDTLEYLIRWAQTNECDVVSGYPEQKLGSVLEKIVMPSVMAFIGANYPFQKVMDTNDELAFANGQIILVRREKYEEIGGHKAVKNEVLEDVAMAQLLKKAGARLGLLDLRGLAETRMYSSHEELLEGWSKNLFLLLNRKISKTILLSILTPLLGSSGLIAIIGLTLPFGLAALVFVTIIQMLIRSFIRVPVIWGLFSSLGSVYLSFLLLRSLFLHTVANQVPWKGRNYHGSAH